MLPGRQRLRDSLGRLFLSFVARVSRLCGWFVNWCRYRVRGVWRCGTVGRALTRTHEGVRYCLDCSVGCRRFAMTSR